MNWKQALVVGGALLVLTACDQATAPQPQLRQTTQKAAANGGKNAPNTITPTTTTLTTQTLDCRSGYSISSGDKCGQ
jgi:hypothetical protein